MGDPQRPADVSDQPGLFVSAPKEPMGRGKLIGATIAVAVILVAAVFFFRTSHSNPPLPQNTKLPADSYAGKLAFSQLAMSESTSLSGGKSTFIDGHIMNTGADTLTGVTLQVLFRNDVGLSPQVETLPLTLIRTHEPYVDTEPVSAAPLKPGDDPEFRLIVETVSANWNQQMPELVVVQVKKR